MNTTKKKERKEKLLAFLKSLSREEQDAFAERVGTTRGQMSLIAYGERPCNAQYAVNIDRETHGAVPMQELHPDLDWDHILTALRQHDLSFDWAKVKRAMHDAIDGVDLGDRVPMRRSKKDDSISAS